VSLRVRYWGARGSIPTPGPEMTRYGGNTSCVELTLSDGSEVILDAGTGIRELGRARHHGAEPVHVLLTHLHLDHIQGLMFFAPLFDPECEVKISGPPSLDGPLLKRLARYISAPLAPVEIRELPARVSFEEAPAQRWKLGPAVVEAVFVNHRGPTLGYRITDGDATIAYIPDHEPALGQQIDRSDVEWVSGSALARDADLLIHDAQYTDAEYGGHVGWGHSAVSDTIAFANRTGAQRLALFHHDPVHDDDDLDALADEARDLAGDRLEELTIAREGDTLELPT
jgi:phosphoribosyl 1,2-cyclic phosphodiesterase